MEQKLQVMTTLRLKHDLHEGLRQIAHDRRRSLHSLLIEGAHVVVAKYRHAEADDAGSPAAASDPN